MPRRHPRSMADGTCSTEFAKHVFPRLTNPAPIRFVRDHAARSFSAEKRRRDGSGRSVCSSCSRTADGTTLRRHRSIGEDVRAHRRAKKARADQSASMPLRRVRLAWRRPQRSRHGGRCPSTSLSADAKRPSLCASLVAPPSRSAQPAPEPASVASDRAIDKRESTATCTNLISR